jgi:glucose/arabinose dehydrogenase
MNNLRKIGVIFLWFGILMAAAWGCSNTPQPDNDPDVLDFPELPATLPDSFNGVEFNPVGAALSTLSGLVDIEFLPGQGGDALVIDLGGRVFYVNFDGSSFTQVGDPVDISVGTDSEQGLLNVAADPDYDGNSAVYFYLTSPGGADNRVVRYDVSVVEPGGPFSLNDPQTIIVFPKNENPNFGGNHNGGGMIFDTAGNMYLGVGDGGGSGSADKDLAISQDPALNLGKIHRIVPRATGDTGGGGEGSGYDLPTAPLGDLNEPNPEGPDSIYAYGMRNPFTLVNKPEDDQFVGDVGSGGNGPNDNGAFEEINCLYDAGENFGWPLFEGPEGQPQFQPATWGYRHDDSTFSDEDPEGNPTDGHSIMTLAFFEGSNPNYGGDLFDRRLIYSEFYQGWVRAFEMAPNFVSVADDPIGHQEGLTSLQRNPADDFYYGVSLTGGNQILKMELVP